MTSPTASLDQSRLESLLESAKLLNSTLNLDDLLGHLLRTVMGRYLIGRGVVATQEGDVATVQVSRGVAALKKGMEFSIGAARSAGLELFFEIGASGEQAGILALGRPARGPLES